VRHDSPAYVTNGREHDFREVGIAQEQVGRNGVDEPQLQLVQKKTALKKLRAM
jgi:hypothetical protein